MYLFLFLFLSLQYADGEVLVQFNDGTQLSAHAVNSSMTKIQHTDVAGNALTFSGSDVLPPYVKEKLERLPIVITTLKKQSHASKVTMLR